jgi:hypothetical protein
MHYFPQYQRRDIEGLSFEEIFKMRDWMIEQKYIKVDFAEDTNSISFNNIADFSKYLNAGK